MSDCEDESCPICYEPMDEDESNLFKLECGHIFHTNCIINSFRLSATTCPMCRAHPSGNPDDYRDPEVHLRAPVLVRRIRGSNKDIKDIVKESNSLYKEMSSKRKILNGLIKEKIDEVVSNIEKLEEYTEYCEMVKQYTKFKAKYTRKMGIELEKKDKASATFFKNGFCRWHRYSRNRNKYLPSSCVKKIKQSKIYAVTKF